jgi:hypothetical protein
MRPLRMGNCCVRAEVWVKQGISGVDTQAVGM